MAAGWVCRMTVALAIMVAGCSNDDAVAPPLAGPRFGTREDPIAPLDPPTDLVPSRVALGERLFDDPILSGDGQVRCTTCHLFEKGAADGRQISRLDNRAQAPTYNTPTLFNVGLNHRFNWTARFRDLEEQLEAPLTSPAVMNATFAGVLEKLRASSEYPKLFTAAYDDGITEANLRDAMATYQKSLVTPNSAFDRWLRGDKGALSAEQREGYELFKSRGCISCHQGTNVGGNLVERFGAMTERVKEGPLTEGDRGRATITKAESDESVFRVPSLRNVALTAPYFHDGSAATLPIAVDVMATLQLGQSLTERETDLLVAFLGSLTGEYRGKPL
jgi:cytochrome c peroxidase